MLCVSHSDRPIEFERCRRDFLAEHYNVPDRLPPAEPFEKLKPFIELSPFVGDITLWQFENGDLSRPVFRQHLRPEWYKPQFALWHAQQLWVLGIDTLEVYDPGLQLVASVTDPWMSGCHALAVDGNGDMLVSCSSSDSILILDRTSRAVKAALRMPEEIYGFNYPLKRTDSVIDHYIPNPSQLTHVNCVWPWNGGILVSTMIQGAIGWFDPEYRYRELTRGFIGCHGARVTDNGTIYFSDSCSGEILFLDERFGAARRYATGSIWLHDALQLSGDVFAAALSDSNSVRILDLASGDCLAELAGGDFGNTTQFISYGS